MNTPICDFVTAYADKDTVRLHMPGHKGRDILMGFEHLDITEINGADVLYHENGIIAESQRNAAELFGTAKTVYSAEGSTLCIRAMLQMASLHAKAQGKQPHIAAARNAHKAFMTALALLDVDVSWMYGEGESLLSCRITPNTLEAHIANHHPTAVYITSPDYLGNTADIAALSAVCRRYGVLLLVDNAHGAYLRFLPQDAHPITLGADMCCDSAHKTLPVLTGGAYLHISKTADPLLADFAADAMALFASTSPSYLILQSLDAANAYLAHEYRAVLEGVVHEVMCAKHILCENGYTVIGDEPLKITVLAKPYGYTGDMLAERLQANDIVCEFFDADHLTCMFTPETGEDGIARFVAAMTAIPRQPTIPDQPPRPYAAMVKMTPREALLSPCESVSIENARGRVLASAAVSCPPAVPIVVCGEQIDDTAITMFRYYGINTCKVVKE